VRASRTSRAALAVALVLLAGCSGDDQQEGLPGGPSSKRFTLHPRGSVEGTSNGYLEYLPPGYGDGRGRPLLISLHGAGENGDGSESGLDLLSLTGIPLLIKYDRWPQSRPFIVLMPQHQADSPDTVCPDSDEIDRFLRFALERYDVDRSRVYLTGFSCGAIGAWEYLGEHADELVAGAVLIAGDGHRAVAQAACALARVPIWAIHGRFDNVVNPVGSTRPIALLRRMCVTPKPVDLRLTIYPNGDHGVSSQTYDLSAGHDVYAWLLRHRRA
jgi:predicted peptidase